MRSYDAIVIGLGGVGSAAAFHLARRGQRVLGLERFTAAHDRGSSHGQTRVIRQAYCEHPDYVPLVLRAYELWAELAERRGEKLYHETGLLEVGPPDGFVIPGVHASAKHHGLEVERIAAGDLAARFPGFVLPDGAEAVFERRAGYLRVERCVLAHLEAARQLGADLRFETTVRAWSAGGSGAGPGGVVVETDRGRFTADRLVIAAGAWARELLADLGVELTVLRKTLHWFATDDARYREESGCPVFLFELVGGEVFYGFPRIDALGVKAAAHHGGTPVADPLTVSREVAPGDAAPVERFLSAALPGVSRRATAHAVCFYTMSPDQHFIIDTHPLHPAVSFCAGLSGHGFKFTPVLGEALADLAASGGTALPIGFLRATRGGLYG